MDLYILYLLGFITVAAFTDATSTKAKNLALYGKATQSDLVHSQYAGEAHASNVIDGNTDSHFHHGSCSHTDVQKNPWWRVDLLDEYTVTSITITNRGDCCAERINGAEIRIGNSLYNNGNDNPRAAVITGSQTSMTFKLTKGFSGRYVNVVIPGENKILTLCEVEVYGYPTPQGQNVALGGRATQSSLYAHNFAFSAIDGNRNGAYSYGSCAHTQNDFGPWWRVDLLKRHKVFSISIFNREDAVPQRLLGAEIRIGDSLNNNGNNNPRCAVVSTIGKNPQSYNCNGMEGQYVNIVVAGRAEYLTLCEVEVYGVPLI